MNDNQTKKALTLLKEAQDLLYRFLGHRADNWIEKYQQLLGELNEAEEHF